MGTTPYKLAAAIFERKWSLANVQCQRNLTLWAIGICIMRIASVETFAFSKQTLLIEQKMGLKHDFQAQENIK